MTATLSDSVERMIDVLERAMRISKSLSFVVGALMQLEADQVSSTFSMLNENAYTVRPLKNGLCCPF